MLTYEQQTQVNHLACLAVLAMCARGVASTEFDQEAEVREILIRVSRPDGGSVELPVEIEYLSLGGLAVGGMSL